MSETGQLVGTNKNFSEIVTFIEQKSRQLIKEHVYSYYEDVSRTMEIFKDEMWVLKGQLTSSVEAVNVLLKVYQESAEMDVNFIR